MERSIDGLAMVIMIDENYRVELHSNDRPAPQVSNNKQWFRRYRCYGRNGFDKPVIIRLKRVMKNLIF